MSEKTTLDAWMVNDSPENDEKKDLPQTLCDEAVRLYENRKSKEALVMINVAIDHDGTNSEYFSIKARILQDLNRYSESKKAFDESLDLKDDSDVRAGKAMMLYEWANSSNDKPKALDLITEAIETAQTVPDFNEFRLWYLKGSILDCMSKPIEARRCYLIAEGEIEEAERIQEQMDLITNSKDTLINITGTQFYYGLEPFRQGQILDLISEDDNENDPDAVRVEIDGETVGYVANSDYTLIEGIKSATEIREKNPKRAEVMFIYFEAYVIAKLV